MVTIFVKVGGSIDTLVAMVLVAQVARREDVNKRISVCDVLLLSDHFLMSRSVGVELMGSLI